MGYHCSSRQHTTEPHRIPILYHEYRLETMGSHGFPMVKYLVFTTYHGIPQHPVGNHKILWEPMVYYGIPMGYFCKGIPPPQKKKKHLWLVACLQSIDERSAHQSYSLLLYFMVSHLSPHLIQFYLLLQTHPAALSRRFKVSRRHEHIGLLSGLSLQSHALLDYRHINNGTYIQVQACII